MQEDSEGIVKNGINRNEDVVLLLVRIRSLLPVQVLPVIHLLIALLVLDVLHALHVLLAILASACVVSSSFYEHLYQCRWQLQPKCSRSPLMLKYLVLPRLLSKLQSEHWRGTSL